MTAAIEALDLGARLIGLAIYGDATRWDGDEASLTADTIGDFEAGPLGQADEIHEVEGVRIFEWKSTKDNRRKVEWYIADFGDRRVFIKN